jgi:DNA-binding IclR family transcriptional regulator
VNDIQQELLKFIQKSGAIKLNDVNSRFGLSIGEARSFLFALIHKGFLKADLENDDLRNNPTLWPAS